MVNGLAQGLDAVRLLREAELGVPLFAHRVGAALWMRGQIGVAPAVVAQVTRLLGSDYILVASFTGRMADSPADVRAQIAACHAAAPRSTAVLGAGVGPDNAAAQVDAAGTRSGLMVLLGSAAYAHPGGPREAVAATVAAVRA
jgi:ribulose 1,5-bisphosphate carboxylase large subunit-like protein